MSYRLNPGESPAHGLKRVIFEEIDAALGLIAGTGNRDVAVHEARKSVKKIRAILRLLRPKLPDLYRAENKRMGAIGAALYLLVLVLAGWEAHRKLRSPKVSPQMKGLTCCLAAGVIAVLFRELTYSSLLEHTATAMLFAMAIALATVEEPA